MLVTFDAAIADPSTLSTSLWPNFTLPKKIAIATFSFSLNLLNLADVNSYNFDYIGIQSLRRSLQITVYKEDDTNSGAKSAPAIAAGGREKSFKLLGARSRHYRLPSLRSLNPAANRVRTFLKSIHRHTRVSARQFLDEGNRDGLQVRAEGEQTAVAILHDKLTRMPRHVGKSPSKFHALGCVLGVKCVRIFDE
jgi:hypothetical protein